MFIFIRQNLKISAPTVFLCIIWIVVLLSHVASAQQDNQTLFNQAVDQFNFATMKYVLAADTKKAEAVALSQKLDSLAFDSNKLKEAIVKVYNTNSRTEELSVKILRFKDTYSARKPVENQLDAVIAFIKDDRKEKREYLAQLEKELQTIRDHTLENAIQPQIVKTAVAGKMAALQSEVTTGTTASQSAGTSPVILYILAIIAVAASLANLWFYRKLSSKSNHFVSRSGVEKILRRSRDFEVFPMLEKRTSELEQRIEQLRQELEALSAGKILPKENKSAEPVNRNFADRETNIYAEPVKTHREPVTENPVNIFPGKVVELQVNKTTVEPPKTQKKYADYPKENGFLLSQLTDSSDRRSIYEITLPPDGDQAQFTIVDNKEIHEYAIQNRERLLKDACDFEISSSQHTRIVVEMPGRLQKNGNTLLIQSKAKIKFV